jgi:hypothetical protein
MNACIAIDDWKLDIFKRHLNAVGYYYTIEPGFTYYSVNTGLTHETLLLRVITEDEEELSVVVMAAQREAAEAL